jgi:DNA-binding NarL/FixJ family response regulator
MPTGSLRGDDVVVHGDAVVRGRRARVALADDDVLLGEGLASLLERSRFEVVGQAWDAARLLALVREHRPEHGIAADGLDAYGSVQHTS